jgi:hypothetical protein
MIDRCMILVRERAVLNSQYHETYTAFYFLCAGSVPVGVREES